ncbi:MAG TPA: hypothetical protein PLM24_02360, partial [Methanothrix sp.]|nr:hypothetical protein [Methanothrix sp.]
VRARVPQKQGLKHQVVSYGGPQSGVRARVPQKQGLKQTGPAVEDLDAKGSGREFHKNKD